MKLNENVKRVLLCSLWDLATCSKEGMPNVVPVTFKGILDDGTLTVGDVFLETTLRNLEENGGRIASEGRVDNCSSKGYCYLARP